ncbi:MAG: trypsin-like peptidase domain-containing protein [Armatimonadota bacterium]|nr:trypsin-like peptidase domain-containing protein [Armatimonadota bacterium]MDR7400865.1 trypsin-like peptidase domain-containing protein [Armatimonadota bacterium]MDR7405099.1 trypsin-like peptidase domain-containing protein [Armatimonadota bacterium]MDR7437822.1 trypsin-like peptidase domain-containing protein [Armatimonadota bacterium]MDR7473147.1 trypsin-like peptidase domain-containing protein [Armatimonadota bacterium]
MSTRVPAALVVAGLLALAVPSGAQDVLTPGVEAVDRAVVLIGAEYRSGARTVHGSGSGIVVDPAGLILTAHHVVDGAAALEVRWPDGRALPATVVGVDRVYDAALVRVQPVDRVAAAALGSSASLAPGDTVVALGRSPRRREGATAGVFLHVDREIRPGAPYLVSTAIVYPGDSGGALVTTRGEVVGVIVALTRNGQLSLSLAADAVRSVWDGLLAGEVRHPWLGIVGRTLTPELAAQLGLPVTSGVLVLEVVAGGPASVAGLRGASGRDVPRDGDVIVAIDGQPVASFGSLAAYVLGRRVGDAVTLEIVRDGQRVTTTVILAERPAL